MTDRRSFLSVQHSTKDMVENSMKNWEHALIVEKLDIELRIIRFSKKMITRLIGEFAMIREQIEEDSNVVSGTLCVQ